MTSGTTLALVGATGGAGTTRLTVEFGVTLARAGRSVAILDAAFATQGLAAHVPGRIDPDVTTLVTDHGVRTDTDTKADMETSLADGLVDHPADVDGRLAICPAHASFQRLARAKTPDAARKFEDLIATAAVQFDHVLVDTPPVASNQAVAAASATERVALVVPASSRGADHLPHQRDRLRDLDMPADCIIANRVDGDNPIETADALVPESDATAVPDLPVCADPDSTFAPAVATAVECVFDTTLDLEFSSDGVLDTYISR